MEKRLWSGFCDEVYLEKINSELNREVRHESKGRLKNNAMWNVRIYEVMVGKLNVGILTLF